MDLKKKQDEFDVVKWYDSIRIGADTCGEYDFCSYCRKEKTYPCARAMTRADGGYIRLASYIPRKKTQKEEAEN